MAARDLYLGLDFGTSGVRAVLIDAQERLRGSAAVPLPAPERRSDGATVQDPALWWQVLTGLLEELGAGTDLAAVRALAVDGTSGTLLLTDAAGAPLAPARLYNDQSATAQGARIDAVAPAETMARGAGGTLARLLALLEEVGSPARHALHQADWIAGRLAGRYGFSDVNNCLKLGYDVLANAWPDWMSALEFDRTLLPEVGAPGDVLGTIDPALARRLGFAADCRVLRGTTDGNAAFLAAGETQPGCAVTSLGSTLTVKLVSDRPVFDPALGVYSHRLGGLWLAGGASNSGGAAIARHFSPERIAALVPTLRPDEPTGLDYYPLPGPGERFPRADPNKVPCFEPRPAEDARFLQAILEGIAGIEAEAYRVLQAFGAPPLRSVETVGGGAANPAWTAIRARLLGVPVTPALHSEAAFGTARLARLGSAGRLAA